MKLIIAGSRTILCSPKEIHAMIEYFKLKPSLIISGTARGADQSGEQYAHMFKIPIQQFPAQWDLYGPSAGHRRNAEMAQVGDALLLIWDGSSKGSAGMKLLMQRARKPIHEMILKL